MNKDLQIVAFGVGRETFGLPISAVREIVRVPTITSVPNAPDFIQGVINLRGRIIPVVDLRTRLGDRESQLTKKSRVVIAECAGRLIGLIVNFASEVLRVSPSSIETLGDVFGQGEVDCVAGVAKLKGGLVILLDLEKVLKAAESNSLQSFTAPHNPFADAAQPFGAS